MVFYHISGIKVSLEGITTSQKSYFHIPFYEVQVCFLLQRNESSNSHGVLTLLLSIMQIIFLLRDNAILPHFE